MFDYAFLYHHYPIQRPRIISAYADALQRGETLNLTTPYQWASGASRGVAMGISADLAARNVPHTWDVDRKTYTITIKPGQGS